MPLGDTLPLRDLAPPADAREPPVRPSTRIRRDTRVEVEVLRRRRSQTALAAVLGLLFVALLSGVVAALASRQESSPAVEATPGRAIEPAPAPAPAATPATEGRPAEPQTAAAPEPSASVAEPPPPSVSATAPPAPAPRPARARPARNPPGVGGKSGSGDNAPPRNELLDPYGPTGR